MKIYKTTSYQNKRMIFLLILFLIIVVVIINFFLKNIIESIVIQTKSTNYSSSVSSETISTGDLIGISGSGWDYITDLETTDEGEIIGVGSVSYYESENGVDVNGDGTNEITPTGSDDGLIVKYSSNREYEWSAVFGGTGEDEFTGVTATSDGGFAIVGSTDSQAVYYDGTYIEELSSSLDSETLGNKDAVLIKVNSSGGYEWGVRFGGTLDDEATAVIETSDGNIAITGAYYSSTFNFLNTGSEDVQASITKGSSTVTIMNGFVASYTSSGTYSWSQNISGSYDSEVVDITETSEGIAIAVNHISTVYLDTSKSTSQAGASTSYVNGTVVGYDLDGSYSWRYRFYPSSSSYNVEITSLSTGLDEEIYVGVNHAYTLYGGQNGSTGDVITSSTTYYAATVVEITNTGEYTETIYTLDGAYDDYVSGVAATADGGVLIGGWTYTTSAIDADGDGETGGDYDIVAITGTYTCDGFIIKLDEEGEVEYLSQIYGDGYDVVTSVVEAPNEATEDSVSTSYESYVAGGSFTSTTLNMTNTENDITLTNGGNADGFIFTYFSDTEQESQKNSQTTEDESGSLTKTAEWIDKENGEALITLEATVNLEEEVETTALYVTTLCYAHGLTQDIVVANIEYLCENYNYVDVIAIGNSGESGISDTTRFTNSSTTTEIEEFLNEAKTTGYPHYTTNINIALQKYLFGNYGDEYISSENLTNDPTAIYVSGDYIYDLGVTRMGRYIQHRKIF